MRLPPTPWELGGFDITQLDEFQNFGRDKSAKISSDLLPLFI